MGEAPAQTRPAMRILQFCTDFLPGGGIQRHVMDLTRCLRGQGHGVVLAGEPGAGAEGEPTASFVDLPLHRVSLPGGAIPPRLFYALVSAWRLRRALRRHRIELVHVHETAPALVARLAAIGLGIPIVMTFHGSENERLDSAARIARTCADLVISPSSTTLGFLTDRGVPSERTRHMGLGVHPLPAVDSRNVRETRRALLGGDDGILVFSLSRLDRQKGIDVMIEVARRVLEERSDVVFAVAGGPGSDSDHVEQWAREAGVERHVRFLGVTREVALHLAASDIYLLTSRWEALPISIVEAFRAGLPVIATDCGGVKELVSPSVGRLCPVEDAEAITAAVLELADDPALRAHLGDAARTLSTAARFSPEAVYSEFEGVYEDVLSARAPEPA